MATSSKESFITFNPTCDDRYTIAVPSCGPCPCSNAPCDVGLLKLQHPPKEKAVWHRYFHWSTNNKFECALGRLLSLNGHDRFTLWNHALRALLSAESGDGSPCSAVTSAFYHRRGMVLKMITLPFSCPKFMFGGSPPVYM